MDVPQVGWDCILNQLATKYDFVNFNAHVRTRPKHPRRFRRQLGVHKRQWMPIRSTSAVRAWAMARPGATWHSTAECALPCSWFGEVAADFFFRPYCHARAPGSDADRDLIRVEHCDSAPRTQASANAVIPAPSRRKLASQSYTTMPKIHMARQLIAAHLVDEP